MSRRFADRRARWLQPHERNALRLRRSSTNKVVHSHRGRTAGRNQQLPFAPPEDWYEPTEEPRGYRFIVQNPGQGYRHVCTQAEVRERLAQLPAGFVDALEVVQFSRVTRKKQSYPCYGMQWGSTIYLYPIEIDLVEHYTQPPRPSQMNEARMYGGRWVQETERAWRLVWTEQAIKDFYLNNILIHELGHLLDERNSRSIDRERFAEWFAVQYGYLPTKRNREPREVVRRHGRR